MRALMAFAMLLLFGMAAAVMSARPADAAIRCEGSLQVQKSGARIVTPYCEDNYLAQVARGYGVRTSASYIRGNYNEKRRVCEIVGHDNRVRNACAAFSNDRGRCKYPPC